MRFLTTCLIVLVPALCGCKKQSGTATTPEQLTDQQKTEIAAQVMRGERPQSDLQKYGIHVGQPQTLSADDFEKQLQKERAATQP